MEVMQEGIAQLGLGRIGRDFDKQFLPHRVKLTLEGIDGRGG